MRGQSGLKSLKLSKGGQTREWFNCLQSSHVMHETGSRLKSCGLLLHRNPFHTFQVLIFLSSYAQLFVGIQTLILSQCSCWPYRLRHELLHLWQNSCLFKWISEGLETILSQVSWNCQVQWLHSKYCKIVPDLSAISIHVLENKSPIVSKGIGKLLLWRCP